MAAATANADRPEGAAPIADPEEAVRSVPPLRREIVAEEEVEAWSRVDADRPVEAAFAGGIYATGAGWGKHTNDVESAYRRRRFVKRTIHGEVAGVYPLPLALSLQLPGLQSRDMLWGDSYAGGAAPGLFRAVTEPLSPHSVLAKLDELEKAMVAKPTPIKREVRIEWTALGDVHPAKPGAAAENPYDAPRSRSAQLR